MSEKKSPQKECENKTGNTPETYKDNVSMLIGGVNEFSSKESISLTKNALKRLYKNKMAMVSFVIFILYVCITLGAGLLPLYSYKTQIVEHNHLPPSLTKNAGVLWYEKEHSRIEKRMARENRAMTEEEKAKLQTIAYKIKNDRKIIDGKEVNPHERKYLWGTDSLGRDIFSRTIYGGRISISIGLIGAFTAVLIGIIIGSLAGFYGGKVDYILMRFVDILYSLPYMLLVIVLMAVLGRGVLNLYIALACVSWLTVARVVRGQIISLRNVEFIEAARTMGASTTRIIARQMLPNTMGIIIVFTTLRIPAFIIAEAFLSFLGLGVSAPLTSWGLLIGEAVSFLQVEPGLLLFPAATMTLFLFSMNFLGDGIRDAFDPKGKTVSE